MTTIDLSGSPPPRSTWQAALTWVAGAIVYSLVLTGQVGLPLSISLQQGFVYVGLLALISTPARRWARRTLSRDWRALTLVAAHLGVAVATVAAWFGANVVWDRIVTGPRFWGLIYANNYLFMLLSSFMTYGAVIGITVAVEGRQRERERERREAALLLQARNAELGAIRSQFQPHFVLNALNSLLALIDREPALARTMVVRLADVMKEVFARESQPMVSLDREIELVRAYLDVEQLRFGSRLSVSFDIDEAARQILVPAFLLQPIVENAVKHGVAPYVQAGTVAVVAKVVQGRLTVTVTDSGEKLESSAGSAGRGLSLTERRLETIYGDQASLSLERGGAGTLARVTVPANPGLQGFHAG